MATTKEDQAIEFAGEVLNLHGQLRALRDQINGAVTRYNKEVYSGVWNALKTAPQNADGSLGAADGSPVVTNPIDTRVAGQTALAKDVSATQLIAGITLFLQLQNFFGNVAVIQGDYSKTIDDLAS